MKYYSEKLNKLFDTEKELRDAEQKESRLGYWELTLSNAMAELAEKNKKLEDEIDKCVAEIGEEMCDKLLDKIFENKAVLKDTKVLDEQPRPTQKAQPKEKIKKTNDDVNKLLSNDDVNKLLSGMNSEKQPMPIEINWNGLFDLLDKIFGEDE